MRALVLVLVVVAIGVAIGVPRAAAQPAPCPACVRGNELIDRFKLAEVRALAGELTVPLADPLGAEDYARVVELRRRAPASVRLGAIDDSDLAAIASAICAAPSGSCVDASAHALRCLADRCKVALPPPDPRRDILKPSETCGPYSGRKPPSRFGVGFDTGTGWQRSKYPADGRTWSFGIETRMRLGRRYGVIARVDRSKGRDLATDANDDGDDDMWTGSITRISALAGPSIAFDLSAYEGTERFLRLDLLGGYIATRSQAAEDGPAAGFDIAFQLAIVRLGARFVQGFGDARDATMVLAHLGFVGGGGPIAGDNGCDAKPPTRSSRLAIGFDLPLIGYGISSELGVETFGLGVEALWHLTPRFDFATHADLLYFPGYERERVIHQALLGGMRVDHAPGKRTSWFSTYMAGYSHAAGITPSTGTGPVGDLSIGWGTQDGDGAAYFRLHGRFGISPDNVDYRALFISGGFELRFDSKTWRDRP